jgi:hypothetical protein
MQDYQFIKLFLTIQRVEETKYIKNNKGNSVIVGEVTSLYLSSSLVQLATFAVLT